MTCVTNIVIIESKRLAKDINTGNLDGMSRVIKGVGLDLLLHNASAYVRKKKGTKSNVYEVLLGADGPLLPVKASEVKRVVAKFDFSVFIEEHNRIRIEPYSSIFNSYRLDSIIRKNVNNYEKSG